MEKDLCICCAFLLALSSAVPARAVTVDVGIDDPVIAFAADELKRILRETSDRITLREDASLRAQQWRIRSGQDGSLVISGRDGTGIEFPFAGLWGVDSKGRNALTIPCVNFFPGTHGWRDFACVVEASRLRRYASKVEGPIDLAFRVNLCRQTGTVSVENVEVIPLDKIR